jgi:hypothetical protein
LKNVGARKGSPHEFDADRKAVSGEPGGNGQGRERYGWAQVSIVAATRLVLGVGVLQNVRCKQCGLVIDPG